MFKKLKGLFIEEDLNDSKKASAGEKKSTPNEGPVEPISETSEIGSDMISSGPVKTSGKPGDKFVDILLKAVEKNNMDGFDYLEFKSSLQSLSGMEMDDSTKYKSALAMAKTMGATPSKLIDSATHYITVLKKENAKFKTALKSQRTKQVTGREGEIKTTRAAIEAKKKKIAELQKQIEKDEKSLKVLKEEINKAAAKVQKTSDNFNYAFSVVSGQIQADIENMKKFLSK